MKHTNKDAQNQRMLDLAGVKNSLKEEKRGLGDLVDYKRGADGVAYGIIKENHHYFLKKSSVSTEPDVADFAYIGGLENITNFRFNRLAEADKNRNMILHNINEAFEGKPLISQKKKAIKGKLTEGAEEEIAAAEDTLGDVEVAVEKEKAAEVPVDVPVDEPLDVDALDVSEPAGGGEMPVDGPPMDEPAGGGEMPVDGPPMDEPAGDGEEPVGDAEMDDLEGGDVNNEIKKYIGKAGQLAAGADLDKGTIEQQIAEFLGYYKDKLADPALFDVGDRKELAKKEIVNVEQEEGDAEAELEKDALEAEPEPEMVAEPEVEPEMEMAEERTCDECGFAKFAESKGYDAQSLYEASLEEKADLCSSYAMENEQLSEEDYQSMATIADGGVMESLKEEYGHEDLAECMEPFVKKINEVEDTDKKSKVDGMFWWKIEPQKEKDSTLKTLTEQEIAEYDAMEESEFAAMEEATLEELNLRGLKRAGSFMKDKAKGAVQGAVKGVGDAVKGVGQAVVGKVEQTIQNLDQLGTSIAQEYQKGVKETVEAKLQKAAQKFGEVVNKLDDASQKAGDGPLNKQSVVMSLQSILKGNMEETMNGIDPAAVDVQPPINEDEEEKVDDIEVAVDDVAPEVDAVVEPENGDDAPEIDMTPGFEVMGGGMPKPDGADMETEEVGGSEAEIEIKDSTVNITLNETLKAVNEMLDTLKEEMNLPEAYDDQGWSDYRHLDGIERADPNDRELMTQAFRFHFKSDLDQNSDLYYKANDLEPQEILELLKFKKDHYDYVLSVEPDSGGLTLVAPNAANDGQGNPVSNTGAGVPSLPPTPKGGMNENEVKLRKYIRARLEENAGMRKSVLNEDKKSPKTRELDKMIDEQFQQFESSLGEGGFKDALGKLGQIGTGAGKVKADIVAQLPQLEQSQDEAQMDMLLSAMPKVSPVVQSYIERADAATKLNVLRQVAADTAKSVGKLQVGSTDGEWIKYLPYEETTAQSGFSSKAGRSRLGLG